MAAALVETIAGEGRRRSSRSSRPSPASELVGWRYVPPFDYYYKTPGPDPGQAQGRRHAAHRLAGRGGRLRHHRQRHGRRPPGPGVRRSRLRRAAGRAGPVRRRRGPAADLRGRPRRQVHRRSARLPGPLGQGRRQGHHPRAARRGHAASTRSSTCTTIRSAGGPTKIRSSSIRARAGSSARRSSRTRCWPTTAQINWLPEHIRDGRFGNFLETNVDWALSRERYWGTPLPIWVCEKTGHMEAVGQLRRTAGQAGRRRAPRSGTKAKQAKPDAARRPARSTSRTSTRSPTTRPRSPGRADAARARGDRLLVRLRGDAVRPVGLSAPGRARASDSPTQFPADFISEAIDQTRGWFYSLLAISTLLFGDETSSEPERRRRPRPPVAYPHPFRNCIVLGLMLGEDGQKMSKSKRNYREPQRDLRPLRGRRPALVLLRQPAAVDVDPLQRAGDQGEHPRVPAAAVERLQLLRDLRQHRRLRSGRRDRGRRRASLTPDDARPAPRATGPSPSGASSTAGSSAS